MEIRHLLVLLASCAAEAPAPPVTVIAKPAELVVSTPFDEEVPQIRKGTIHGWQAAIGAWSVRDGALHGDELPEDHHASSCTHGVEAGDLVITAECRLGAAAHLAIGCRDAIAPHHHLARLYIAADGLWIQRMSGIAKTTRAEKVAERSVRIDPDAWHSVTIEIVDDRYRATVDDVVVEAHAERFRDAKALVALITKGQGAQFRNVAIWKAVPVEQ